MSNFLEHKNSLSFYDFTQSKFCLKFWVNDELYSLNDLISNFEYEKTCFLEAIVNASEKFHKGLLEKQEDLVRFEDLELWENVEKSWTTKRFYCRFKQDYKVEGRPTSERLDWLFQTFNHLLEG